LPDKCGEDEDEMSEEYSLEDVLIVLRRRALYFVVPILVIVPIGLAIIMLLPPLYQAEGKILVESQQISQALVQSTVNSYIEERLQTIRQRVTTRGQMLEIADKFDLFPKEMGLSESERVKRMKAAFDIKLISSATKKNRNQSGNTVAFTLSYTDASPDKAFQVANEFMTRILSEDVRTRTQGASTATEFFSAESRRLADAIDKVEAEIADYKAKNADALPADLNIHQQLLIQSEQDLARVGGLITQTEDEITSLQTQVATYLAGTGGSSGPAQEILRLKTQLAALRADKTDAHPDVIAVIQKIASLLRQLAPSATVQGLRRQLATADQALRDARAATPVDEALVKQRRNEATEAREKLSSQIAREAAAGSADIMLTQLQGRMDVAGSRLVALDEQAEGLKKTIAAMTDSIARTPLVERGLSTLTRDSQNLNNEYQALKNKQATAQLSENLEDNQQAERLSILESAQRPDAPTSPNRLQLAILLLGAALAVGACVAFAAEMLMQTLRGRSHLVSIANEAPIAVIPYFKAENAPRFSFSAFNRKKPA
jgi:uncharacterized protein involved in exopolysaccharide biosynthesis